MVRNPNYRNGSSQNAERLARFEQQMADFARGERLIDLRKARHLSQEDAAHEIGTSAKSLRSWEHGGTIRWENAKRVAQFYEVEAETLVSRELKDPEPLTVLSEDDAERLRRIEEKLDEILKRTASPEEPGKVPPPEEELGDEPLPQTPRPDEEDTASAETG